MTISQSAGTAPRKPLRLWPGVAALIVQWLLWFVVPVVAPEAVMVSALGGIAGGLAVVIWWVFLSRAPWSERLGAIVVTVVAVIATRQLLDGSIQTGINGAMFYIYVIPGVTLALVAGAVAGRRLSARPRRALMVAAILLACGVWTLLRAEGFRVGQVQLAWRWTATPEERLLGKAGKDLVAAASGSGHRAGTMAAAEWPGFRGPGRDGLVRGVRIGTDWSASPPVELWRRPVGPGWSSFAVQGPLLYTQEQRGGEEIVAAYEVATGRPAWVHRDATRFWESYGGAGPRATPTVSDGRVYALGATGILNALDAGDGALVWSRNAASDTGAKLPTWGFSGSPLVVDGDVIVAASGTLAAYDAATGDPRWVGPHHGGTYSSPQLATLDGVPQILLLSPPGATSVAPADGGLLWEHSWQGLAIVQPALTADGDLLIHATGGGKGIGVRRLSIGHGAEGWRVEERWTSNGLKPYFNDFVVHQGHAFGFDGGILASIDLEDGRRAWKGGRYGHGQLVLLPDQDLLLVLSEEGELALVRATPDRFAEVARFPALEGKTWNHPVLVGDLLLVRNGQEMAAFRLSLAGP